MLDVYTDWLEAFIGGTPKVKEFNGNNLRYKLTGESEHYANYSINNQFGYNSALMDELDEANTLTIATHEAGHYWTITNKFKLIIVAQMLIATLLLLNCLLPIMLVGIISIIVAMLYRGKAEYDAENFVCKYLGYSMSFNTIMNISEKLNKFNIHFIKETLKELNINYENSNENK